MKGLRIGRRRARTESAASPLELALRPALVEGRWQVPDRFNLTRDVVEALASDPKRNAVTVLGQDGVIEPRTFLEIAEAAATRAAALSEQGVHPKDRVILMAETSMHWLELVLGIWKAGAVAVPVRPSLGARELEALHGSTGASLVVAEPGCSSTISAMSFAPDVLYVEDVPRKRGSDVLKVGPTHATSSRDLALVFVSPGTAGAAKEIGHTHGAVFASRAQAEHWLDAGRGDIVWCTAAADSPLAAWFTIAGPWSRGAESVIHQGEFDAQERLEHLYRIGPTILCQSAAEYRALAGHGKLERFRPPRLRRLVSTGDVLEPDVQEIFQASWGLAIHDGYGQAETGIVAGNVRDGMWKAGSIGRPLPGYDVAIVDDQGNELPHGIEGDLAIRGQPPTLFAGYWEAPEETKRAFRGDLYLTGDVAVADDEGFLTFVARAEDVITSSGRTFGPYEVEYVLRSHAAIAASAVVGIRDLQRGGHFVRAFVVPVRGTVGSEQLEAELRQFLGQVLPEQQVPREIVFVEQLPTVRGRLSRSALRERPLAGRPLWEMPPTTEPEAASPPRVEPEAPRQAAEALPVVVPEPEPVPEPVELPPIVVVPEPAAVVQVVPEPILVEPNPAEPIPVEPVPAEPAPEPEPPPVVEAEPVASIPEPEPMVVEAEPVARIPEPEPIVVEVEPTPAPEPKPEPLPEPTVIEPVAEAKVVEAAAVEPVAEPTPEPERVPEPAAEAESEPEPEPEPERKPELRIVPAPDAAAPPGGRQAAPVPAPLPEPNAAPPPPAREPEPLPDYVVPPEAGTERAAAPPPPPPEPEPEPDLGPLPDYIVDPDRPPPPRPEPRPAQSPAPAAPAPQRGLEEETSGAAAAGIYFPPVTSFPAPRDDDEDAVEAEPRKTPRRRPAPEPPKSKPKRSQEDPGDDAGEAAWMAGLSNRLSAYSLAEEGDQSEDGASSDDSEEESSEQAS